MPIVEERDVLRPGEACHHAQPVLAGQVEQIERRGRIGAHGVDPGARHEMEVAVDKATFGKVVAVSARRERTVRDAAHEKSTMVDVNELSVNTRGSRAMGDVDVRIH